MNISIAREEHHLENRAALTPAAVNLLARAGHHVYIQSGAGKGAGFSDSRYSDAGGKIVFSKDEAFKRCDILLKVFPPTLDEYNLLNDDQIIMSALHLVSTHADVINVLIEKRITAIGFEVIEDQYGSLPVLTPMSELAGQMALPIASYYLSNIGGGRGILLGGGAGIPPAIVVVLGAGTVGINAVRIAKGLGCNVILMDNSLERLRSANDLFSKQLITYLPYQYNLERVIPIADVVIGAILIHGEETPKLITEQLVGKMKPGSVILDISIDQGGCFETSRPTSWAGPTYVVHGVTHFCVPNMPSNVGRTATYALANAVLPYIKQIADIGLDNALTKDKGLAKGVYTYKGELTHASVAKRFGMKFRPLSEILTGR